MEFNWLGKTLIFFGAVLILVGGVFLLSDKVHWFGRLPGDIMIRKNFFTFFFPITTCILISIILSIIFYFLGRR
ncbi:MAG: DUF2905 domain-containing protein [Candidatus Omnitrophica bacterium]|nr:DUF2905 domain-containing protein [Candidatus Omnitrophota bacterium]